MRIAYYILVKIKNIKMEEMENSNMVLKKLVIEVEKDSFNEYLIDDEKFFPFEYWPTEAQVEALNAVLILYNLHLIPEDVFRKKYLKLVEEYSFFLHMSKDLAGVKSKKK